MLHYTRYSGTVVALRGSGQGKGFGTSTWLMHGTRCREPPKRHATQQSTWGATFLPPNLSLGGLVCGHKALIMLGQELETVVSEYALSGPSGIWLLRSVRKQTLKQLLR